MLPTTSRSLSLIRLRDMCLISRLFEPITKTSSITGSGADGASAGGGGGFVTDGMRLIVTSISVGVSFVEEPSCQTSDYDQLNAKPAPNARNHANRGAQRSVQAP